MDELINGFTGFAQKASKDNEKKLRTGTARPDTQSAVRLGKDLSGVNLDRSQEPADRPEPFDPRKLALIPEADRRWAWTEIDTNAIRQNVAAVRRNIPPRTRVLAVVKADGYGHGAVEVARAALAAGAYCLGVATVSEAIDLREALVNAPILILSQPPESAIPLLLAYKICPAIYTSDFAIRYAEAADARGLTAPFHLAINTGMNRIGVRHDEVVSFLMQVGFHRALELRGVFTHFATADEPETLDFGIQAKRFVEAVNAIKQAGIDPGIVHCANSATTLRYPEMQFDMVRAGLVMYGFHPCPETERFAKLTPAMSVHARITDERLVPMSEGVSYGMHYRSPGHVKICTVPIGYCDGFRRNLSGQTDVICNGELFRQVGNICMDQFMFEVDMRTHGAGKRYEPHIGDEVLIVGQQGNACIRLDDMAYQLGTIPYEIMIGFGHRLPRRYK